MRRFFKVIGDIFNLAFLFVVGLIVGALLFYAYMEIRHMGLEFVRVPDVQGMSASRAVEILQRHHLRVKMNGKCEKIIGTYPRAGLLVRAGREIELFCLESTVQDVLRRIVGVPLKYAAETMMNLGWKYEISRIPYPGEDGRVIAAVSKGGKVYLLVDSGRPKKFFMVPELRGMDKEEAIKMLKGKGIDYRIEGKGEYVVDQFPQPGSVANYIVLFLK